MEPRLDPPNPSAPRHRVIRLAGYLPLSVWAVTLLGLLLRAWHLGAESLWMDEVRQVRMYHHSEHLWHLIWSAAGQQQPPLDYLIGWALAQLLPFSEVVARLPALIFGTAMIPLVFLLGSRVSSRRAGQGAAWLVALCPPLVQYAQEARPYSIYACLLLVLLLATLRFVDSPEIAKRSGLGWPAFLLLMSRGMEPLLALTSLGITFLLLLPRRRWRAALQPLVLAGLAFLPFFGVIVVRSVQYLGGAPSHVQASRLQRLALWPQMIREATTGLAPHAWPLLLGGAALGLLGLWQRRRIDHHALVLPVFFLVVIPLHTFVYALSVDAKEAPFHARYLLYSLPILCLLAAVGWDLLGQRWPKFSLLLVLAVIGSAALLAQDLPDVYRLRKVDYRALGQVLESQARYGDVVLRSSWRRRGGWQADVYGEGLYWQLPLPRLQVAELTKEIAEKPEEHRRIFLVLQGLADTPLPVPAGVVQTRLRGLVLLQAQGDLPWRDAMLRLLDLMLATYPQDDSRLEPLLAKAQLLCAQDPGSADKVLDSARLFQQEAPLPAHCQGLGR